MRISGGSAKGRKLGFKRAFLKKGQEDDLRPTSAKVREALFSILAGRLADALFLDLYAGTGAVGLEALSRGAAEAVFVEESAARAKAIRELVERFGFTERAQVVRERAEIFLKKTDRVFDIIFVDPPYASSELEKALPLIGAGGIVQEEGVVIAEHPSKRALPASLGSLELKKRYTYGDTALSLYRREELRPQERP